MDCLSGGAAQTGGIPVRPQFVYNALAVTGWAVYVAWRALTVRGVAAGWGLRRRGFVAAMKAAAPVIGAIVALMVLAGWLAGHMPLPRSFWCVLGIYPGWGLAQQFVLQALVVRNLRDVLPRRAVRVTVASALFCVAHFPDLPLMLLTLAAGIILTYIYERHRNLWAVGLLHGLLGTLAYYLLLGRDAGADLARCFG